MWDNFFRNMKGEIMIESKEVTQERKTNKYGLEMFSKEKSQFIAFYKEHLEAELEKLEIKRQQFMKGLIPRVIAAPFLIMIIYYAFHEFTIFVVPAAPIAVFGWIGLYWMRHKSKLEAQAKALIIPELIQFMNPHFTYDPEASLTLKDVNSMHIFKNKADNIVGDDLIEGYVYDAQEQARTKVSFSEVGVLNTRKIYQGKKIISKPLGVLAIGLLFKADFNKDFGKSFTMIKPRWLLKKRKYRKKLRLFDKHSNMQEVHLENPEFSKQFIVHSNDQIEARVILQADTMENILAFVNYLPDTIERKPKRRKRSRFIPYITFHNNQVYVLIHTKSNHFILNIMKKLDIDTVYDYFKDINLVLRFIDDLNLNLKLYQK